MAVTLMRMAVEVWTRDLGEVKSETSGATGSSGHGTAGPDDSKIYEGDEQSPAVSTAAELYAPIALPWLQAFHLFFAIGAVVNLVTDCIGTPDPVSEGPKRGGLLACSIGFCVGAVVLLALERVYVIPSSGDASVVDIGKSGMFHPFRQTTSTTVGFVITVILLPIAQGFGNIQFYWSSGELVAQAVAAYAPGGDRDSSKVTDVLIGPYLWWYLAVQTLKVITPLATDWCNANTTLIRRKQVVDSILALEVKVYSVTIPNYKTKKAGKPESNSDREERLRKIYKTNAEESISNPAKKLQAGLQNISTIGSGAIMMGTVSPELLLIQVAFYSPLSSSSL